MLKYFDRTLKSLVLVFKSSFEKKEIKIVRGSVIICKPFQFDRDSPLRQKVSHSQRSILEKRNFEIP